MLKKTGMLLSAAFVLDAVLSASVAAKAIVVAATAVGSYDVIPGYDRDGGVVALPNPDRS